MGQLLFDQFSFLHFCVGGVVYFWGISFLSWIALHTLFEIVENSDWGMHIINKYITVWPGGKPRADSLLNAVADTAMGALGFVVAQSRCPLHFYLASRDDPPKTDVGFLQKNPFLSNNPLKIFAPQYYF